MRSVALASLIVVFASALDSQRSVVTPTGTIEALGVCDVTPDMSACWDMDGRSSTGLNEALRGYLTSSRDVSFRLNSKNRFLVVRRPQRLPVQYRSSTNEYLNASFNYTGDMTTDFVRCAVPRTTETFDLSVVTTLESPTDDVIDFREGAVANVSGRRIEIGGSQKVDHKAKGVAAEPYSSASLQGTDWMVAMGVTNAPDVVGGYQVAPLDATGEPIRYVDLEGKPLTPVQALTLEPNLQSADGFPHQPNPTTSKKPKAVPAVFQLSSGIAFQARTNIDPKRIAKLRVHTSRQVTNALGPFPLDPK